MTCPQCGCTLFFDCECPTTVEIFQQAVDYYHADLVANGTIFRSLEEQRDQ